MTYVNIIFTTFIIIIHNTPIDYAHIHMITKTFIVSPLYNLLFIYIANIATL